MRFAELTASYGRDRAWIAFHRSTAGAMPNATRAEVWGVCGSGFNREERRE